MSTAAPPLDYASPTGRSRRRRLIVLGVLLAVVALSAGEAYRHRDYLDHVKLLYAQYQCMHYTPPAGQIVYDEDPATIAALKSARNYVVAPEEMSVQRALVYVPDCWGPIKASDGWYEMQESFSHEIGSTTAAIAFLHRRKSPSGHERLVAVEIVPGSDPILAANSIHPAGLRPSPPSVLSWSSLRVERYPTPEHFRVWAGVADPSDQSHFTIDYQIGNDRGTIDGWLRDNDNVELTPRLGWTDASGGPDDLVWSPQNFAAHLLTLQPTGRLQFLNPSDGKPEQCLHLAYSNDGRYLAVVTYQHVFIRNLRTGKMQTMIALSPTANDATHLIFSADGNRIATAHRGGWIYVWRTGDGQPVGNLRGPTDDIGAMAFSADGSDVFAAYTHPNSHTVTATTLIECDVARGKIVQTIGPMNLVQCMTLAPDGETLYAGCAAPDTGGLILTLDLRTGHMTRRTIAGVGGTLDFSTDCKSLIARDNTDSGSGGCMVVDVASEKIVLERHIPDGGLDVLNGGGGAAISPSGKGFACAADLFSGTANPTENSGVCLWDLPNANELWELTLPAVESADDLAFSSDGRILAIDAGREILLCDLPPSLGKP